ncbi:hypothetical protein JTB14_018166 [Gonioctena quinquepunctata]|nr:hypothetical protein JTB14_018166 [Gonioctena quinquepunctata]
MLMDIYPILYDMKNSPHHQEIQYCHSWRIISPNHRLVIFDFLRVPLLRTLYRCYEMLTTPQVSASPGPPTLPATQYSILNHRM